MTFVIEHVGTGAREDVTEEQWNQVNKLFPRMFRKVTPNIENLSDEAKEIISKANLEEE